VERNNYNPLNLSTVHTIFGCDLRTLALFRIGIGVALFLDLLSRARDFRAHYTYWGVLPPPTDQESFIPSWIYLLMGSTWFEFGIFLFAGLAALAVIVGYQTTLATVTSWGLLFFIQTRNDLLIQGGDDLLILLFFWGIFLPLGARFSFDASVDQTCPKESLNSYFSMGTLAILLQVACLYFFSALQKHTQEWIPDGTALYYVLHLESFVQPMGQWLREYVSLLQGLTYFTWVLELIGPFLLFSPWFFLPIRLGLLVGFILLHLGIAAFINVGLFPLFNIVSLLLFLPSWFWDKLTPVTQTPARRGLIVFFDEDSEFCRKMCFLLKTFLLHPNMQIFPAQQHPLIWQIMERDNTWVVQDHHGGMHTQWNAVIFLVRQSPLWWPAAGLLNLPPLRLFGAVIYQKIATSRASLSHFTRFALPYHHLELQPPLTGEIIVGLLTIYMVFINLITVPNLPFKLSDPLVIVQNTFKLNQKWNMFAPPRKYSGWYVIPGHLVDGTIIDVYNFQMPPIPLENSSYEQSKYANHRWRKYLQRLVQKKHQKYRNHYGKYLCRQWNENRLPSKHLDFFEVYFIVAETPPPYLIQRKAHEPLMIWKQHCP